jgi:glycosyltransferase involved in cell wall biosynthesis
MSNSKICHVTLGHDARDDRIFYKEAISLRRIYDRVAVLAIGPEGQQVVDGVKIVNVPAGRSILSTVWRLWRAARAQRARCYHLHEPELLPVALLLKGCYRVRIVYDIHEPLQEMLADFSTRSGFVRAALAHLMFLVERWLVQLSDAVVVTSDLILHRYGRGRSKVVAIYNYPRRELFTLSQKVPSELKGKYRHRRIILYHGQLGRARDIATLIRATKRAAEWVPNVTLLLLGPIFGIGYREELIRIIEQEEAQDLVELLDPVPHHLVPNYLTLAEIGLVVLPPLSVFRNSPPIKLFEYMSCGLPVIGSRLPVIERIIHQTGCGIITEPSNAISVAQAIRYLLTHRQEAAHMGRNGVQAVRDLYNWNRMEARLFDLYSELIGTPS